MEKILKNLTESGLSDKEARVYYSALNLGPTSVLKLAHQSDLKRATVYTVIDSLVNKGLMRIDDSRMKKLFVAEDPINLQRVVEQKAQAVSDAIPELQTIYKKGGRERVVKTYEGIHALENVFDRLMNEARSGDYRYFIGGDLGWQDVDKSHQEKYFKWRERIHLDVKLLFQDSDRALIHEKLAGPLRHEVRTLPKNMNLESDLVITPRILVITKLSPPISAIVIEDQDIIQTYHALFMYLWNTL